MLEGKKGEEGGGGGEGEGGEGGKWQQRRRKTNPRGVLEGLEYQKCLRI